MRALALSLIAILTATLALSLTFAPPTFAKPSQWQKAKVVNITSESGGAVAAPIGAMIVGVRQLLNVTLYGKTKIAVDGRNAHILDDEGKDRKVPIAQKIARTKEP